VRNSYIAFDVASMEIVSSHSEIVKTVLMRDLCFMVYFRVKNTKMADSGSIATLMKMLL
jgi:hypothetical protein